MDFYTSSATDSFSYWGPVTLCRAEVLSESVAPEESVTLAPIEVLTHVPEAILDGQLVTSNVFSPHVVDLDSRVEVSAFIGEVLDCGLKCAQSVYKYRLSG